VTQVLVLSHELFEDLLAEVALVVGEHALNARLGQALCKGGLAIFLLALSSVGYRLLPYVHTGNKLVIDGRKK